MLYDGLMVFDNEMEANTDHESRGNFYSRYVLSVRLLCEHVYVQIDLLFVFHSNRSVEFACRLRQNGEEKKTSG